MCVSVTGLLATRHVRPRSWLCHPLQGPRGLRGCSRGGTRGKGAESCHFGGRSPSRSQDPLAAIPRRTQKQQEEFLQWQWAGLKVSSICDGANLPPEHPSGLPAAGSTRGQEEASSSRWSIHQGLLATRRLREGRGGEGGSPQHVPMPEQHSPSRSRWGWQGQWGSGAEHTPGTGASRQHRGSPASSACNGAASRN